MNEIHKLTRELEKSFVSDDYVMALRLITRLIIELNLLRHDTFLRIK